MVEKSSRLGGLAAVAEVSIFFAAFFLVVKYLSLTPPAIIHFRILGWNFFAHAMMVIAPIGLIFLRRESLADYGLQRGQLRDPETRRLGRVAFVELAVIWLVGLAVASRGGHYRLTLNLPLEWFAMTWPIKAIWRNLIGLMLTVIFEVFFCGVGEEVMFRGYIQGRLNHAFGRPWNLWGVQVGWGLILSSVIFGIAHALGNFNPFGGFDLKELRWSWSVVGITGVEGMILGLLRDKSNGIAAPVMIHAIICLLFGTVMVS